MPENPSAPFPLPPMERAQAAGVSVTIRSGLAIAAIMASQGQEAGLSEALRRRSGVAPPGPGQIAAVPGLTLVWSGPGRWLALCEEGGSDWSEALQTALEGVAGVVDLSDSRVVLRVEGPGAVAVLSRLLPIDLHPRAFGPQATALTVAAHIPVQVWRAGQGFEIACPTSYAASFCRYLDMAC